MTAAETRQQLPPVPSSSAPVASCATKGWSDPFASPDEDIHEFIRQCLSETPPGGAFTRPAPWPESRALRAWGSDYTDWYADGHRTVLSLSSRKTGKTALSTSLGKVLGARPTHCVIDEIPSFTPKQVAELVSRQQERARALELLAAWPHAARFMDTLWDVDFLPRPRPLLELSLASPVFRSPIPLPAGAGTR